MTFITKYRPATLEEVVGQPQVVKSLASVIKKGSSRTFLFTGNPGTGKTTLARIVASMVGCKDGNVIQIDAATKTGIDDMREVINSLAYKPLGGSTRVIILDEAHALSKAAMTSLLNALEEPRPWNYWCLCTTEPTKIPKNIQTRCTIYSLRDLTDNELYDFLCGIADKEKILLDKTGDAIIGLCADEANGSPRQALANLSVCAECTTKADAAELLHSAVDSPAAFELAQLLASNNPAWARAVALLKTDLAETSPESIRHVIRAYFTKMVIGSSDFKKARRGLAVLEAFSKPFNSHDGITPVVLALGVLFAP